MGDLEPETSTIILLRELTQESNDMRLYLRGFFKIALDTSDWKLE